MKFIKLLLTNGQEIEINRDLIKAIIPEGDRLYRADLIGNNEPIEFHAQPSVIQRAIDKNELTMRMLPVVTAALLQPAMLDRLKESGKGKVLAELVVDEAREITAHMVAREVFGQKIGMNEKTVFGRMVEIRP